MRSPSIVPGFDVDVYLFLDDFGRVGRAYRETDEEEAVVISDFARNVLGHIARPPFGRVKGHYSRTGEQTSAGVRDFIDYQLELGKRYVSAG